MMTRTDPPVSQAQRRWAFANKNKPGKEGAAAKEFAEADPGGKLPERAKDDSLLGSIGKALVSNPVKPSPPGYTSNQDSRMSKIDAIADELGAINDCLDRAEKRMDAVERSDEWSDEARAAALEARRRKSGSGSGKKKEESGGKAKTQNPPDDRSPFTHPSGQRATSGYSFYEKARKTSGTFSGAEPWESLSPEAKHKWHEIAFNMEKGLFGRMKQYAGEDK